LALLAEKLTVRELKSHININHPNLSLTKQAELLGISRSSLYYQPKPVDPFTLSVMHEIDSVYTDCPFYGVRRITHQLKRNGFKVNHKRVHRLMGLMGLEAIYPKPNLSKPSKQNQTYPYLLKGLTISEPNQVWGVDITYIRLKTSWLYLVAILDWFSRYALAWKLSDSLCSDFCTETLKQALAKAVPYIHNSDQGSQFTSDEYLDLLKSQPSIRISMDGRGRCFDNIFNERLWRTIKYEEVYLKDYQSTSEAKQSLDDYLNFYNHKRLHSSLNYQTPAEIYKRR
jgi:putative transposase